MYAVVSNYYLCHVRVEEGILRLLALQKQLRSREGEIDPAALADATADLVPQMLQVLHVARNVCEENRARVKDACHEQNMGVDAWPFFCLSGVR